VSPGNNDREHRGPGVAKNFQRRGRKFIESKNLFVFMPAADLSSLIVIPKRAFAEGEAVTGVGQWTSGAGKDPI
jgi:hypothetical protein